MFRSKVLVGAVFFLVGAVFLTVIVSMGLVVGLVLNWLVPAIELGIATLCGLVAVAVFASVVKAMMLASVTENIAADRTSEFEDANDEVSLSDEQFDTLADQLSEAVLMRVAAKDAWIRPKSRSRR